jgi:hypothetical protein
MEMIQQARMPRRAKAILNNMLRERLITPEGVRWLILATDPFHDEQVDNPGHPSMAITKSIRQTVHSTFAVNNNGLTGSYDVHVFFLPLTPCFTQADGLVAKQLADGNFIGISMSEEKELNDWKRVASLLQGGSEEQKAVLKKISETEARMERERFKIKLKTKAPTTVTQTGYFRTTIDEFGTMTQTGSGIKLYAGWNIIVVPTGEDWYSSTSAISLPNESINPTYASGVWRLCTSGIEVTNTTAQIYKNGAVTTYRSPSCSTPTSVDVVEDTRMNLTLRGAVTLPPGTVEDASIYPNSETWAAEKGVYMVSTLNNAENGYYMPTPGAAGAVVPRDYTDLQVGAGWLGWMPDLQDFGLRQLNSSLSTTLPMDVTGCVFSGLTNESTLQVTSRYYFEKIPTWADPNLLVLATHGCPYDPVALEIYSRALPSLPVGVEVGMNPLGEWFTEVMQGVADWAPKIGNALGSLGIPVVGAIGNLVGDAAGAAAKKNRTPAPSSEMITQAPSTQKQKQKNNNPSQTLTTAQLAKRVQQNKKKAEKRAIQKAMLAALNNANT